MINLFIDTSYKSLVLAILKDDNLVDEIQIMSEFNFSEVMLPKLNELLIKNNIKINDINKIYAVVGPGSFTGIRIGLTAAKTIAYVLNIKVVPLSSLEFMATSSFDTKYIVPIIDARHNMVFGGIYDQEGNCTFCDKYCSLDELNSHLDDTFTYVTFDSIIPNYIKPHYNVEKIVRKHLKDAGLNAHEIKPNYLKKTEAEEKLNDTRS